MLSQKMNVPDGGGRKGALALVAGLFLLSCPAQARVEVDFYGEVKSDIRFVIEEDPGGGQDGFVFSRNDNALRLGVNVDLTPTIRAKGEVEMIFTGFSRTETFGDLVLREKLDPFRFESDAVYLDMTDVGIKGLDIRIGRQVVTWGTADIFSPTDNINPDDFEDPLLFGQNMANQMVVVRYNPVGDLTLSLVWVPVFRPSQLPMTAQAALLDTDFVDFLEEAKADPMLISLFRSLRDVIQIRYSFDPLEPPLAIENSQVGAKLSWAVWDIDMSLSYYYGYDDVPRMENTWAVPSEDLTIVDAAVTLTYPRMHVIGFDFATSLPFLFDIGLWGEVALILHEDLFQHIYVSPVTLPGTQNSLAFAPLHYNEIPSSPFIKATAGLDYTFFRVVYLNVQYVYGLFDEFGWDNLHHFLVPGLDVKLLEDRILLRLFTVLQLDELDRGSMVLYPEVKFMPWDSVELSLGAIFYLGEDGTKFGASSAGRNEAFLRAKVWF